MTARTLSPGTLSPRSGMGRTARFVFILGGLTAFGPLSIDMYLPAFPALSGDFRVSPSVVQLTLTACLVGLALGQLVAGPLSDTVGRRRPLLVGLLIYTVVSLMCALAPSAYALAGLRFVQGVGASAGIVIARAAVRDLYSGTALARFFSMLLLVTGLAPILAPVIGGQLLLLTSWRGVFLVLALFGIVLLTSTALALPETLPPDRRRPGSPRDTIRTYRALLTDRGFLGYALTGGLVFGAMFAYISGSSFVLQEIFGLSPQRFSVVFAVNALGLVCAAQLNGRLVGRFPPRRLLAIGVSGSAVGGITLLLTALTGLGFVGIVIPLFVVVASVGLVMPNSTALALADHPRTAGTAAALLGVIQFVVGGLAAPLVGLSGAHSAVPMTVAIAAMSIAAITMFTTLTRPRTGVEPPAMADSMS